MSWASTYTHSLAIGLDQFGAAIFFNRNDITISSLCRIVQLADAKAPGWLLRLATLKLAPWQVVALRALARLLNDIQTNHCELARLSDIARGQSAVALLLVNTDAAGTANQ